MINRRFVRSRSLRSRLLSMGLRYRLKPRLVSEEFDPVRYRRWLDANLGNEPAKTVVVDEVETGDLLKGEWLVPARDNTPGCHEEPNPGCVLYLHGGGYLFGSPKSYRNFTSRLAEASATRVYALDYRLAPEHPFPAAVDDALAAYKALLQRDFKAEQIVIVGDSAGAGLTLAMLHGLKAEGQPMPAAVIALSPYSDLLATGASLESNSRSCVMFTAALIRRTAARYLNGADGASPFASPLYGDFAGFPPTLIYASDSETLLHDSTRLAGKMDEKGVSVTLNIWKGQPHVWPIFCPFLPEARSCIAEMARFIEAHLAGSKPEQVIRPQKLTGQGT